MKKGGIISAIVSAILCCILLFAAGCSGNVGTSNDTVSIGILQYVTHEALDQAREGFVSALKDAGYVEGENLALDVQNAQEDSTNLMTMSERFVNNKVDLILAIATPAAQAIAGVTSEIPVLFTAVTDPVDARLMTDANNPGGNISGTNDMNPIKEQVDLMMRLCPNTKTMGIIYNSSEDNSVLQANIALACAQALGLGIVVQTVTSSNDVQQATQSLVKKCDAIYVPTDNTFATALPALSAVALEAGVPLICGESGMVKDGGLATLGLNYFNLGYQTGEMAVRLLKGESISSMAVESLKDYDFLINGEVAEALSITIPEDLMEFVFFPGDAE